MIKRKTEKKTKQHLKNVESNKSFNANIWDLQYKAYDDKVVRYNINQDNITTNSIIVEISGICFHIIISVIILCYFIPTLSADIAIKPNVSLRKILVGSDAVFFSTYEIQRFLIDGLPYFLTDDNKNYSKINNIIDSYIGTSDIEIVTSFQLITTRYKEYENTAHYTSLSPYYYDPYWGGEGSAVPTNFTDGNYTFIYKNNATQVQMLNGSIEYNEIAPYYFASIPVNTDHYPFYMSKLVLDGFLDNFVNTFSLS